MRIGPNPVKSKGASIEAFGVLPPTPWPLPGRSNERGEGIGERRLIEQGQRESMPSFAFPKVAMFGGTERHAMTPAANPTVMDVLGRSQKAGPTSRRRDAPGASRGGGCSPPWALDWLRQAISRMSSHLVAGGTPEPPAARQCVWSSLISIIKCFQFFKGRELAHEVVCHSVSEDQNPQDTPK